MHTLFSMHRFHLEKNVCFIHRIDFTRNERYTIYSKGDLFFSFGIDFHGAKEAIFMLCYALHKIYKQRYDC